MRYKTYNFGNETDKEKNHHTLVLIPFEEHPPAPSPSPFVKKKPCDSPFGRFP